MALPEKHRQTILERVASASIGALLTSTFVTPLEVVKVRLQSSNARLVGVDQARYPMECASCRDIIISNGLMEHRMRKNKVCCDQAKPVKFTSAAHALVWIVRCEGVGSLFNGLQPTLWMAVPATVLYFATYEEIRDNLNKTRPEWKDFNPLIAGASARILAATTVAPLELLRTNAQAQVHPESMTRMALDIARTKGLSAFWRGLSPTLWRDVPFSAIYWILVEESKARSSWLQRQSTFVSNLVSGATSGVLAAIFTHPFDVIKTRRQVFHLSMDDGLIFQPGHPSGQLAGFPSSSTIKSAMDVVRPPASSTFGMMKYIVETEGLRGLFSGIVPRMLKIAPSTAIMLTSYEVGKEVFHRAAVERKL